MQETNSTAIITKKFITVLLITLQRNFVMNVKNSVLFVKTCCGHYLQDGCT